jgi:hypothetical protein
LIVCLFIPFPIMGAEEKVKLNTSILARAL